MTTSTLPQLQITAVQKLFEQYSRFLIITPKHVQFDCAAAAIGTALYLKENGKTVELVIPGIEQITGQFAFLPALPVVHPSIQSRQKIVITVPTPQVEIESVTSDAQPETLQITIQAKSGYIDSSAITVPQEEKQFDVIICVGAAELADFGDIFTRHAQHFYNSIIINIDTALTNQHYGAVNVVDITSLSLSAITTQLIGAAHVPKAAADCFLGGILHATNTFQHVRTTPQLLEAAANLIDAGAEQQQVVRYLFKTKSFSQLKLWGRLLARSQELDGKVLYSTLHQADFEKSGTTPAAVPEAFRDLVEAVSGFEALYVLAETPTGVFVYVAGLPHVAIPEILKKFGAQNMTQVEPIVGNYQTALGFCPGLGLQAATELFILNIKNN